MLIVSLALLLAAPQDAIGVPDTATALGYVGDCLTALRADGVDLAKIEAQGWKSLNARDGSGKPLSTAMYGRQGDMSFLAATKDPKISCVVLTPTNGMARAEALRDALNARLGTKPSGTIPTKLVWTAEGRRVELSPMGKATDPSGVKIEVTAVAP
ncbi:hypothetical protein [Sphingomonas sp.]|uniref:hypothetical protein n=1 Tax=Sphingomonas sp. TaxID=28214 RepID=UPI001B20689C|nr:hypothetical protein [Sphingomonas sp.]MBO9714020.1 hypothetical protein [Sphingomonas sp.]